LISPSIAALIRLVFKLPYRQTVGSMQSIAQLMKVDLTIPNFSTSWSERFVFLAMTSLSLRTSLRNPGNIKRFSFTQVDGGDQLLFFYQSLEPDNFVLTTPLINDITISAVTLLGVISSSVAI